MRRPALLISAGEALFASFFSRQQQERLNRSFRWERFETRRLTADFKKQIGLADALITTWDSPHFDDSLLELAPRLRVIAHCGGEVKSRFGRSLFTRLTITNAQDSMARATAELGATLLLYCARNVDFYREALRKQSN